MAKIYAHIRQQALERAANGESVTAIAKDLDISRAIIYRWLNKEREQPGSSTPKSQARLEHEDATSDTVVWAIREVALDHPGLSAEKMSRDLTFAGEKLECSLVRKWLNEYGLSNRKDRVRYLCSLWDRGGDEALSDKRKAALESFSPHFAERSILSSNPGTRFFMYQRPLKINGEIVRQIPRYSFLDLYSMRCETIVDDHEILSKAISQKYYSIVASRFGKRLEQHRLVLPILAWWVGFGQYWEQEPVEVILSPKTCTAVEAATLSKIFENHSIKISITESPPTACVKDLEAALRDYKPAPVPDPGDVPDDWVENGSESRLRPIHESNSMHPNLTIEDLNGAVVKYNQYFPLTLFPDSESADARSGRFPCDETVDDPFSPDALPDESQPQYTPEEEAYQVARLSCEEAPVKRVGSLLDKVAKMLSDWPVSPLQRAGELNRRANTDDKDSEIRRINRKVPFPLVYEKVFGEKLDLENGVCPFCFQESLYYYEKEKEKQSGKEPNNCQCYANRGGKCTGNDPISSINILMDKLEDSLAVLKWLHANIDLPQWGLKNLPKFSEKELKPFRGQAWALVPGSDAEGV